MRLKENLMTSTFSFKTVTGIKIRNTYLNELSSIKIKKMLVLDFVENKSYKWVAVM